MVAELTDFPPQSSHSQQPAPSQRNPSPSQQSPLKPHSSLTPSPSLSQNITVLEKTFENFLLYFSERHRGSEELIKGRLKFYVPLLHTLKELYSHPKALDLGCGRGEFLELLTELNFQAEGVELIPHYVTYTQSKGLKVYHSDALTFLQSQKEATYHLISLIHVIEHLEPEYLFSLFLEIHRTLKEGGILLLETPYTQNIFLGIYNFWLDPTHRRPIPVSLIETLGDYLGFRFLGYFPLQSQKLSSLTSLTLHHVFHAVSPDVSILLLKDTADPTPLQKLTPILMEMKKETTLDLNEALNLYTSQEQKIYHTFAQLQELLPQLQELLQLRHSLSNTLSTSHHALQVAREAHALINMLLTSKPWRLYSLLGNLKRKLKEKLLPKLQSLRNLRTSKGPLKGTASPSPQVPISIPEAPHFLKTPEAHLLKERLIFWSKEPK